MNKFTFIFALVLLYKMSLSAQVPKDYVPCNDMPKIITNYYADVTALNRVYIVNASPEKNVRYKKLAEDYLHKLDSIVFNSLPTECKVDYVLFKRDLDEVVHQANEETKNYDALKQWFPFADSIYVLEKT